MTDHFKSNQQNNNKHKCICHRHKMDVSTNDNVHNKGNIKQRKMPWVISRYIGVLKVGHWRRKKGEAWAFCTTELVFIPRPTSKYLFYFK